MPPTATKTRKSVKKKTVATGAKQQMPANAPGIAVSQFSIGDEITHPQFGDGRITDIEGAKLTIEFADSRIKRIVDYYVKRRKT